MLNCVKDGKWSTVDTFILPAPLNPLENIAQVMQDTNITLTNLSIDMGYRRLYGMQDRLAMDRLLLYLYQFAANSWLNVAGATNFMAPSQYYRLLDSIEKIRKTCECLSLSPTRNF